MAAVTREASRAKDEAAACHASRLVVLERHLTAAREEAADAVQQVPG